MLLHYCVFAVPRSDNVHQWLLMCPSDRHAVLPEHQVKLSQRVSVF